MDIAADEIAMICKLRVRIIDKYGPEGILYRNIPSGSFVLFPNP